MRKPKNGSEGKDRLRALAAAAAKAASSNIATYFADDDKPVNPDGSPIGMPPIKLVPAAVGMTGMSPSAGPVPSDTSLLPASAPAVTATGSEPAQLGGPSLIDPLMYGKPEEIEQQAKQAARAARLITSGDGFGTHMEPSRSTSGELPPQLGPPGPPGQANLEFLPVLPPMHVHSHPVTTGQGQPQVQTPPPAAYARSRGEAAAAVVPKIVLARSSSAGAPGSASSMDLDRARSGSGGLPSHISVGPHQHSPIPQVTISLKRDISPAANHAEERAAAANEGAFVPVSRRRGRGPGLPPLGAKVTGRRGKRAASDVGQPQQRWALLPHAAAASPAAAAGQPPQPQNETPPAVARVPPAAAVGAFPEQPSPAPQPQDEVMTESEAAAGGDVAMEQGGPSGQPGQPTPRPSSGSLSDSGRASSFSPFSVAPPANESTSEESDTESDQSRDKKAAEGQPQASKRTDTDDDEAMRPTKKVRGADGTPQVARAASLGTVIAAVEERATRQGNSTIDAAVGSAPTTVEDCLQSSSFGNVRKNKRSAKPPREEGAPQRVWGSVGGPLASGLEPMPGIASLSLEEQNKRGSRTPAVAVPAAPVAAPAPGRAGASLSSSESAAAISLLALAPQTPPSAPSPSAPPAQNNSGDLEDAAAAAPQVAGPPAGQASAAVPHQTTPMQISGSIAGTAQHAGEGANGAVGAGQGSATTSDGNATGAAANNSNGVASSAGLPIAPLRLDSGLQAQDPNGTAAGDMAMGLWSGKLKHRMATQGGYSTVDLLNLTALIPDRYLEQLPPTLFVTELVARGAVQMNKHYIVQCRLGFLTDRQLTKLQLLANSKLVAVCQLQHCKLTLVPYIEARTGQLRIMGFLIADDLGT
ncbi:g5055 [Coccomyxa elongata]